MKKAIILEKIEKIWKFEEEKQIWNFYDIFSVILKLENDLGNILQWFEENSMVANPKKFQFMVLGYKGRNLGLCVGDRTVVSSDIVNLLGITIDKSLNFNQLIAKLCKKANLKVNALFRIIPKLRNEKKAKLLTDSFFFSIFQYCPMIWMFCSKRMNKLINQLHKKILKLRYQLKGETLYKLLSIDDSHVIHVRNKSLWQKFIKPPIIWIPHLWKKYFR